MAYNKIPFWKEIRTKGDGRPTLVHTPSIKFRLEQMGLTVNWSDRKLMWEVHNGDINNLKSMSYHSLDNINLDDPLRLGE